MKKAILTFLLTTCAASAHAETFELVTRDSSCPDRLEIQEKYLMGSLQQVTVTRDRTDDIYAPETYACESLDGKPYWVNKYSGYYVSCSLKDLDHSNGYALTIIEDSPSRDPSDYGSTTTYTIERMPNGVRVPWGSFLYDGARTMCEYKVAVQHALTASNCCRQGHPSMCC